MSFDRFLPRIVRDLSGASNRRFIEYLTGEIDATIEGSVLVRRLVSGELPNVEAAEQMRSIEHAGDGFREVLESELRSALVTPVDREDLYRISSYIDEVLDNLRDFVSEWQMFGMVRSPIIAPVTAIVVSAITDLRGAVTVILHEPGIITQRAVIVRKGANQIRQAYESQLAALFGEPLLHADELAITTAPTIERDEVLRLLGLLDERSRLLNKQNVLLRRLDVVGLRLGSAASALASAAVKRAAS